ncbi:hypothetical protein J6590_066039 [Homalodisca vitripennis]|nr:hypothetical protein J6590_066039 [Homalodisca vitripennis]
MKINEEISDIESDCDVRSAVNVNHSQAKKRKTFGRLTDAFIAIHGITKKKMEVLQKSLKEFGMSPKDQRGKHSSRPRKLSREQTEAVMGHIRSFKGRKGHYNLAESAKTYLPEDLNIKKMHNMLHDFVYNHLDINVRRIFMFCDSCGGLNKNFTVFRFLHNLVHKENGFDEIKIFFPIRSHSYLETDKNMGLVNQKAKVEQPKEWAEIFREARVKPSPFSVIEVDQLLFRNWSDHLNKIYTKKCPFKTRPVREAKIDISSDCQWTSSLDSYLNAPPARVWRQCGDQSSECYTESVEIGLASVTETVWGTMWRSV